MTYAEKLLHPSWQKKKSAIQARDNFTCQLCGDTETTLHVHHKQYFKDQEPWECPDDNLILYCEDCHRLIECIKKSSYSDFIVLKLHKRKNTTRVRYFAIGETQIFIVYYYFSDSKFDHGSFILHSSFNDILDFYKSNYNG